MQLLVQTWIASACLALTCAGYQPEGDPVYGFPKNKPEYAFDTYVPIQIFTQYPFNISKISLSPLEVYINKKAELIGQNIGYTVYITPKDYNAGYVKGGPFFNEIYEFALIAQNNDGVTYDTRVSTEEDGKGFPAQIQVFYFNKKYKNFLNALKYRDGLAIFLFNLVVTGVEDNPLFYPYQKLLEKIIYPNATAPINNYGALEWLFISLRENYFTYPGAFIDITTRKQYFCATMVESNFDSHSWMSGSQFLAFLNVLNLNYQLQANPLGLYPVFGRPLCQVNGKVVRKYYYPKQYQSQSQYQYQ